jgi:hypothetical protein
MAGEHEALREWHRLFGLLLTDFFTGSPFIVEIERDLSTQQQLLDVVIVRRKRGRFSGRLPDGLDTLAEHNLITFKSHHEALDGWAMRELIGHYVAYRKLVSSTPSDLLPEDRFRLYAVAARFPQNLSNQVPWQRQQAGVYDCRWGLDVVRVVVAGELSREPHNAPLHLFSASAELVGFASGTYQQRSEHTSRLLRQLFEKFQGEGVVMPYTMEDFERQYFVEHFPKLTAEQRSKLLQSLSPKDCRAIVQSLSSEERRAFLELLSAAERQEILQSLSPAKRRELLESLPAAERREILQSLPAEEQEEVFKSLPLEKRLAGLSVEQIRQYLDQLAPGQTSGPRKRRRKK